MPVQWWRNLVAAIWILQVWTPSATIDAPCKFGDTCCAAQKAWETVEAKGGCSTRKTRDDNIVQCEEAESLCKECQEKTSRAQLVPGSGTSNTSQRLNLTQGLLLAALHTDDLEMRCVPPRVPIRCGLQGRGIMIVFLAGVMLLIVLVSGAMIFDSLCLPYAVFQCSRAWLAPYTDIETPYTDIERSPLASASQKMDMHTPEVEGLQSLRELASAAAPPVLASKPEAPPYPRRKKAPPPLGAAIELPASPRIADTCSGNPLEHSKHLGGMISPGIAMGRPVVVTPSSTKAVLEHSIPIPSPRYDYQWPSADSVDSTASLERRWPADLLERRWPARLARLWGFRVAFLSVASIAICARVVHITLSATITFGMTYSRTIVWVIVELSLCLAPYAWCALTTRPPPDSSYGVPSSIGYVCGRIPRFTVFVALMLPMEIYSAVDAAWMVTSKSCDDPAVSHVILYCSDIPVLVLRIYSALLAIRLQDKLAHAARRVLPDNRSVKVPTKAKDRDASLSFTDLTHIEPEEEPDVSGGETRQRSPNVVGRIEVAKQIEYLAEFEDHSEIKAVRKPKRRTSKPCNDDPMPLSCFCSWFGWSSSKSLDDKLRPSSPQSPSSQSSTLGTMGSQCRRCLRIKSRMALILSVGLLLALVAGSISLWVFHAHQEEEPEPPPSSCSTAQNATATCAHFESVGRLLWDSAANDYLAGTAKSMQDCCSGCDGLKDCQGWMFESVAKSCRWIRFLEDPCVKNPGDLRCRCVTHFGTSFGFKPTSKIVWVKRAGLE